MWGECFFWLRRFPFWMSLMCLAGLGTQTRHDAFRNIRIKSSKCRGWGAWGARGCLLVSSQTLLWEFQFTEEKGKERGVVYVCSLYSQYVSCFQAIICSNGKLTKSYEYIADLRTRYGNEETLVMCSQKAALL